MRALESSAGLRLLALCLLYLVQGLTYGFITGTLGGYLAAEGFSLEQVAGLTFMAQVPWTFKFIWGPIIDRFSFPSLQLGRRRPWILVAQSGMVLTLGAILLLPDLDDSLTTLLWLVAVHNTFASLQDVSTDAMAVDLLPEHERGKANGFMRGAVYLGSMTVSLYAVFMTLSWPVIAGTHFTAYMALLNVSLSAGTKIAGSLGDAPSFATVFLAAGLAQIAVAGVIVFIDTGQTRRVLGDGPGRAGTD